MKTCQRDIPSCLKDPLDAQLRQETLQALLAEYSCLRAEAQHDDSHQIQLATITFSTLVAIAGVAAAFPIRSSERAGVFFCFAALPCLAMFMGLLWIDLIYRRTRFGCYTKVLENKIDRLLEPNILAPQRVMEWEHWIRQIESDSALLGNTGYFRGYVVTGSWILAPLLIMGVYFLLEEAPFFAALRRVRVICRAYWPVTLFILAVYIVYFVLYYMFLQKIRRLPLMVP